MDPMDIDHPVDVPDTPDRLAMQTTNDRRCVIRESRSPSIRCHSREQIFCQEGTKNLPVLIDSGRKRLFLRPQKISSGSANYMHPDGSSAFGASSSSSPRDAPPFQSGVPEKNPSFLMDRPSCNSRSSTSRGNNIVDLTHKKLPGPEYGNSSPSGVIGNRQTEVVKKCGIFHGSSSNGLTKFPAVSDVAARGTYSLGPNSEFGDRDDIISNIRSKHDARDFVSLDPSVSSRVYKQKRLVRNGCILPNNIAKAKQLAEKDIKGSISAAQNNNVSLASSSPPMSLDIRELVAEDNNSHKAKGKEVITHPCISKKLDSSYKDSYGRHASNLNEKATEDSYNLRTMGRSVEDSGGWRSTHNRTGKINSPSHEELSVIREISVRKSSSITENKIAGRSEGNVVENGGGHQSNVIPSENVPSQRLKQPIQHARARLGRLNGHGSSSHTLLKRQRQRSTSSFGECSTAASNDPQVVFLSPSSDQANITSTSTSVNNTQPVIDVDELSPDLRHKSLDDASRARQLETDELLARELQEQFYNETPIMEAEEVDAQIAMTLHHQIEADYGFPRAVHPEQDNRGALVSELRRQSQFRPTSNPPRRGNLSRASALGRTTRLRNRFPGQGRTLLPSRSRASLFPASMDVEMRMHILGAMEAFSDMGVNSGILQTQRDFNENDYEMLLALDENNDRHRGASVHRINGLPQSTVQSDNFETCAICLETPAIGDTIRHLPCLHKFHKDCIDPWLRRRTSCPVCKSSIT